MHGKTLVIGGGFAGLQACQALARTRVETVLIDSSPVTTMLPALPDVAGGWVPERLVRRPLGERLSPGIRLLSRRVAAIDLDARTVTAGGETLSYDHLLIAAGSVPDTRGASFPRDRLYVLGTLGDALRIREDFVQYLQTASAPHLLVAGTGYTGLELALSLLSRAKASRRPCRVTLVDPTPVLLPSLPAPQRQYVLDFLADQGVEVRLGAAVESFDGRHAVAGGQAYPDVFFCWAAGSCFAVPEINGKVERLRDGRLRVAPDLSLPHYPEVFVAGDSAAVEQNGQPLRKAVNFAFYGGRHAGGNIARRLRGRATRPFRPVDLGWIVPLHATSIGRLPGNVWVHGLLGVRLHHLMCGLRNYSLANFAGCLRLAWSPNPKGNPV